MHRTPWLLALDPLTSDESLLSLLAVRGDDATPTPAGPQPSDQPATPPAPVIIIPPNRLHLVLDHLPASVMSVAGWPTGQHDPLIKASEARLAVQSGAIGVIVALDPGMDQNNLISEVALYKEAIPHPAQLWIYLHDNQANGRNAELVMQLGATGIVSADTTERTNAHPWGIIRGDKVCFD